MYLPAFVIYTRKVTRTTIDHYQKRTLLLLSLIRLIKALLTGKIKQEFLFFVGLLQITPKFDCSFTIALVLQ